jgi:hypothetical protein
VRHEHCSKEKEKHNKVSWAEREKVAMTRPHTLRPSARDEKTRTKSLRNNCPSTTDYFSKKTAISHLRTENQDRIANLRPRGGTRLKKGQKRYD